MRGLQELDDRGGGASQSCLTGRLTAASAQQEVCIACHGENGVSVAPEYPHLAGQSGAAIYKQLHDYRTGSRVNPQMTDIAKLAL
jgi:cytochrome c553